MKETIMKEPSIEETIQSSRDGTNPGLITPMRSGFLLMGFQQFLPGYVLLFSDPPVPSLDDLSFDARTVFLQDMAIAGEAVLKCTEAYRMNYQILGNKTPALHAHIAPRYLHEDEKFRLTSINKYDDDVFNSVMFDKVKHKPLMDDIKIEIERLIKNLS